jgi:hypothetical protein
MTFPGSCPSLAAWSKARPMRHAQIEDFGDGRLHDPGKGLPYLFAELACDDIGDLLFERPVQVLAGMHQGGRMIWPAALMPAASPPMTMIRMSV